MIHPEVVEQLLVGDYRWVLGNLDRLIVTGMVATVCRVLSSPACEARHCGADAIERFEIFLNTPETAAGEDSSGGIGKRRYKQCAAQQETNDGYFHLFCS